MTVDWPLEETWQWANDIQTELFHSFTIWVHQQYRRNSPFFFFFFFVGGELEFTVKMLLKMCHFCTLNLFIYILFLFINTYILFVCGLT